MDPRYKKRMDRYWDKMRKYAANSFSNLDPSGQFDYWHCHLDWQGKGDVRSENREAATKLGYEVLQMSDKFQSKASGPIQNWWFIHENSYGDAVNLHSPNDNGSPFPYDFEGVAWGEVNHEILDDIVDLTKYKIGVMVSEDVMTYVVAPNQ